MESLDMQLQKANLLEVITQRIGFAIWQIQELEGCAAQYLVLMTQATRGMGEEAGNELVRKAQEKTLGSTIHQARKAGILDETLERRFTALLEERNWLVHKSRGRSRGAIHNIQYADTVIRRIDVMAEEAGALLTEVERLVERRVKSSGIAQNEQQVQERARRLLEEWHNQSPT